jgi:hypothetical protein
MADSDYERRRRAIEQEYLAGLELIREGYLAKLRALEASVADRYETRAESLASAGESASEGTQTASPASVETQSATPPPSRTPAPAPSSAAISVPGPRRSGVMFEILDTFPRLPEIFDRTDVVRLLGYEPSRPSLHRAWDRLLDAGKVVIVLGGHGRRPTKFRKLTPE